MIKPRRFILCPICKSKSKKLFSELGGLQTRRCQSGHVFEVDTFAGLIRYPQRFDPPKKKETAVCVNGDGNQAIAEHGGKLCADCVFRKLSD